MSSTVCCFQGIFSLVNSGDVATNVKRQQMLKQHRSTSRDSLDGDSLCDPSEYEKNDSPSGDKSEAAAVNNAAAENDRFASVAHRVKNSLRLIGDSLSDLSRSMSRTTMVTGNDQLESDAERKDVKARSFEDTDSDSSSDSDEETLRHMQRSIRRTRSQQSLRGSSRLSYATENEDSASGVEVGAVGGAQSRLSPYSMSKTSRHTSLTSLPTPSRSPRQTKSPTSESALSGPSGESYDWMIEDTDSFYSKEGSPIHEDELAAALAARPAVSSDEDDNFTPSDHVPISACGTLDIAVQYSTSERKLQITVVAAKDLPSKDRGGASIIQVRVVVLPTKRKRFKTKVQHVNSPRFSETFKMSHISPEDLRGLGLRLRLYGIGKVKDRLIGEATVRFDELNLIRNPQLTVTLQLEPRTDVNRGDPELSAASQSEADVSSVATLAHGGSLPELLLSLAYNEMTGRLSVEIVKGSHFRNLAMSRPPDTYVKVVLLNSKCQEMAQSKSSIRRAEPNPVFKETFYFQVALFQLAEVSLMISVHCTKTMKRKYMLGWISLGKSSSSVADEQHWREMREAKGQTISRWHTLIES